MRNDLLKKIERILIVIFGILAVIVVIGIVWMLRYGKDATKEKQEEKEEDTYDWEAGLSDQTLWLPRNCKIYSKVPDFTFTDEKGKLHAITEFEGRPTVIVFWASWCGDCNTQMPLMQKYIEASKKYGEVNFLFVNKMDGERETKEAAIEYFKGLGIDEGLYFDEGIKAYDQLGIHNIPTTLFLDANGVITAWSPKQITEQSKFDALLNKAIKGGSDATAKFINSELMDEEGGIHRIHGENKSMTKESEVLSESQGAMLEYAILSKNQPLFDRILYYIKTNLLSEGLTAWQRDNNKASKVNALIDDFRIYNALTQAQSLWGGYETVLDDYKIRFLNYGVKNNKFVDFYDTEEKQYASRFTLCYADFKTMDELAKDNTEFQKAYQTSIGIVEKGQISEEFPLYYSWYNYKKERYEKDDLNTAEAMMTLLHLSEADRLPDNTKNWLKKEMKKDGVKARYTVKGKVVDGYVYDSTAVYAIIAMIGIEEKDTDLVNQAIKKMEKIRIDDSSSIYNGAFGMEDGTGINAFDQVMPLLAYMKVYGS